MKLIPVAALILLSQTATANTCTVTYKAKKIQIDRFLFQEVKNMKYRSGRLTGFGQTKAQCRRDALKPINGWTITYSKFTWGEV